MHFIASVIYWMIHLKLQFEPFFDAYCSSDSAPSHVHPVRYCYHFWRINLIKEQSSTGSLTLSATQKIT